MGKKGFNSSFESSGSFSIKHPSRRDENVGSSFSQSLDDMLEWYNEIREKEETKWGRGLDNSYERGARESDLFHIFLISYCGQEYYYFSTKKKADRKKSVSTLSLLLTLPKKLDSKCRPRRRNISKLMRLVTVLMKISKYQLFFVSLLFYLLPMQLTVSVANRKIKRWKPKYRNRRFNGKLRDNFYLDCKSFNMWTLIYQQRFF